MRLVIFKVDVFLCKSYWNNFTDCHNLQWWISWAQILQRFEADGENTLTSFILYTFLLPITHRELRGEFVTFLFWSFFNISPPWYFSYVSLPVFPHSKILTTSVGVSISFLPVASSSSDWDIWGRGSVKVLYDNASGCISWVAWTFYISWRYLPRWGWKCKSIVQYATMWWNDKVLKLSCVAQVAQRGHISENLLHQSLFSHQTPFPVYHRKLPIFSSVLRSCETLRQAKNILGSHQELFDTQQGLMQNGERYMDKCFRWVKKK